VSRIAFRELDYAAEPDGLPLDPALAERETRREKAAFEDEPYDLVTEMPNFRWPTVVVSGDRDLITPPAVADRVASLVPNAVLLKLPTMAQRAGLSRARRPGDRRRGISRRTRRLGRPGGGAGRAAAAARRALAVEGGRGGRHRRGCPAGPARGADAAAAQVRMNPIAV
jgi:hypothetical protein